MNFDLLEKLCKADGISGREQNIAKLIEEKIASYCDTIEYDDMGNLFCTKKASVKDASTVLLDAHTDAIGLIVTKILENGFLAVQNMGGVDERILPGSEVVIHGREKLRGVIGAKPPHLMKKDEGDETQKIEDMAVDTGLGEEASKLIQVGDVISFVQQADMMGSCVTGTYLDDRAGVCAIIEIFEGLKDKELPFNLVGAFTVQEELGLIGAKFGKISPNLAIIIDVTHGSTPDEKGDRVYTSGGGTAIGVGPNMHSEWVREIRNYAEKEKIPYQLEVMEGNTGTNAWAYQVKNEGVGCLILSFPLKFMHTPVETMVVSDYDNLLTLTEGFIRSLSKEKILELSEGAVLKG